MGTNKIYRLLMEQIKDKEYLNVVNSAEEYELDCFLRKGRWSICKYSVFDIGLIGYDFVFALDETAEKVVLLSGSLENFNKFIFPEYSFGKDERKAKAVAMDSLLWTREFYRYFFVLDEFDKAKKWLKEKDVDALDAEKYSFTYIGDGVNFSVPVIVGNTLLLRKIRVSNSGVFYCDKIVKEDAVKFSTPE